MNEIVGSYKFSWKDLPKIFVIFLGVSVICLLFPNNQNTNFQYQLGQQWNYDNLYAYKEFTSKIQLKKSQESDSIITSYILYKKAELIVANKQYISKELNQTLNQYLPTIQSALGIFNSRGLIYFLGYFILTALIIGALILYSWKYFPQSTNSVKGIVFLIMWPVLFSILVYFVSKSEGLNPYMIPFCIAPIVVSNFYNGRLALVLHIVVILIASFLSSLGYEFIFLQILAGIVAVLVMTETRFWNKFFLGILIILCTYLIAHLGLSIINSGSIMPDEGSVFGWLSINALLLLLSYPFIPMLEKLFGFISDITLAELSDLNKPLLKELSLNAPGTLQHSLQVANLSSAAAKEIGADDLLVKTGALYHDIGKLKNPRYFIENSSGQNLHQEKSNFESAKIIIDHVIDGEQMAKKAKLPSTLIDFITTHHGTTRVEYFYRSQKQDDPNQEFDESLFRYPGPKPVSKEQTILMLADSIEAASKSLKNPVGSDIDTLIDNIVNYKIDQSQLTDSQLSFAELQTCIRVFKSLLRNIYHVRIEYPKDESNKN